MLIVLHCFRVIMPDGDASIRGFAVAGSSAGGHHPSLDLSEESESARKFLVVGRMKSASVVLGLTVFSVVLELMHLCDLGWALFADRMSN